MAWQEIPLPERHGIITGYQMTYRKTDSRSKRDVEKTLTFDGNTHTAFLYKLSPYTNYTITLTGRTSVGYGVQGEVIITTLQGGWYDVELLYGWLLQSWLFLVFKVKCLARKISGKKC